MMRCLSRMSLTLALCVFGLSTCNGQSQTDINEDWHFQYELFQAILEQQGLSPVRSVDVAFESPEESVIVVLGQIDWLSDPRVQHFCSRGGAMLMARDSGHFLGSICTFRPGAVTTDDPADAYQSFSDCILVTDINIDHPLMDGVGSLVVNKSGWLVKPRWANFELNLAAALPRTTNPPASRGGAVLATIDAFSGSGGELIVCSDQSLFTNGMILHADNSLLAINVASLLFGAGRRNIHFVVDGQPLGSYADSPFVDRPSPELQMPDQAAAPTLAEWLRELNTYLKTAEELAPLNTLLANQPSNIRPAYYRRGILFVLGVLAVLCVLWKLLGRHSTPTESMPPRKMVTAYEMQAERRIESSDFGHAASMLARDFCREVTGSGDRAIWIRSLKPSIPDGALPVREESNREPLSKVVDLAVNSQRLHLDERSFTSVGEDINMLRKLHRSGRLLAEENKL